MAELRAARAPPLIASEPPVKKPAMIALYGSSFFLIPFTEQSNNEKRPPQTPKLPLEDYQPKNDPREGKEILTLEQVPLL